MKQGKQDLGQLAQEIIKQNETKQDFIIDTRQLSIRAGEHEQPSLVMVAQDGEKQRLPIKPAALKQITERVGIPSKYADRLAAEAPWLLEANVNHWFSTKPEQRMLRTLDGKARAFLSNRYQRIDNYDLLETVLPILSDESERGLTIKSCEVTDNKLYIKAVTNRIQGEITVGDQVQAGIVISNSEVGFGAIKIQPLIYRLVCSNGMIVNDSQFKRHHVGAKNEIQDRTYKMLSQETLKADDKAILLKVRDIVKASLSQEVFNENVSRLQQASENIIEGNPVKTIEVLAKTMGINQGEQSGILRHLVEGGDLSQWGIINAVTRQSQDIESYDRASEFEAMGGKILDLNPSDWKAMATAN